MQLRTVTKCCLWVYLLNKLVSTNSESSGIIRMIIFRSIISLKVTGGFTSSMPNSVWVFSVYSLLLPAFHRKIKDILLSRSICFLPLPYKAQKWNKRGKSQRQRQLLSSVCFLHAFASEVIPKCSASVTGPCSIIAILISSSEILKYLFVPIYVGHIQPIKNWDSKKWDYSHLLKISDCFFLSCWWNFHCFSFQLTDMN